MPSTITERLNGLTTSVAVKAPCKAVSTTTLTLSGEQTIGGVACVTGDRVLYALTGGSVNNGIWVVSTGAWSRAKDFDGNRDVVTGTLVGIVGVRPFYKVTTSGDITIGTTAISFELTGGPGDGDFLSVKDYSAVGDGTTSDQTAVAAAVLAAYTNGDWLYWPDGTYLTTASIDNFHDVKHWGPGVVKRGSDLYYVQPNSSQTSVIYLSPSGDDANDGLSSSQPMKTLQAGIDALTNATESLLNGTWRLKLAAGNYVRAEFPTYGLLSQNAIEIEGPDVGGHPNVPTAIITDGVNASGNGLVATEPTRLMLRDLKVFGYQDNISANGISGYQIYTENFHAEDCHWGISVSHAGSLLNIKGGIFEHNGYVDGTTPSGSGGAGLRALFHTKLEIGTQNAGSLVQGPFFTNNYNGFFCKEYVTGHIDYCTFEDNAYGVQLWTHSRANLEGSSFKRNSTAIRTVTGSFADPASTTVFGTGADVNTTTVTAGINCLSSGSQALVEGGYQGGHTQFRIKTSAPGTVVTSITSTNTIDSYELVGGFFSGPAFSAVPSKKLRVKVKGTLAGTAGTFKRIALRLGASTVTFASFGSTVVGDFFYEVEVDFIGVAEQVLSSWGLCHGGFYPSCNVAAGTVDMSVNQVLALQAYVDNASDSITIKLVEWFLSGV